MDSFGWSLGLGPGSLAGLTPRPSNLTGAEIYSMSSTMKGLNFNNLDFCSMMGCQGFQMLTIEFWDD